MLTATDHTTLTVKPYNASKAQHLADQDEYQCAFKTLCQDSPVASLDVPTIQHIKDTLYPRPYPHTIPLQQPNTTPDPINNTNKPKPSPSHISPSLFPFILYKKGTATGPLADYTDFLHNFAFHETKNRTRTIRPYLQTFSNIMQLLLDGTISPSIATTF
jgi:hypothetical protein